MKKNNKTINKSFFDTIQDFLGITASKKQMQEKQQKQWPLQVNNAQSYANFMDGKLMRVKDYYEPGDGWFNNLWVSPKEDYANNLTGRTKNSAVMKRNIKKRKNKYFF